ncbi:quinone oxidoreductase [Natronospirillum operosum]|uniref:Quinone oxidoreductase n=2 Tax=Natronospirillum operosum TaxID=2759953 RepID=A0A4Z0W532_9GAMM|nr:quinone oxidoreductase [Natronospirillum operosum]
MKALTFSDFGAADVLEYRSVPVPDVNDGEVLVQMHAIGLNYADIHRRTGAVAIQGKAPFINGYEGAGVVVHARASGFSVGDRVGFADAPFANAEYVAVPETKLIPLGKEVDMELAATVLLQGLTAQYLSMDTHPVQPGDTILVHAAAGGAGQLLVQYCKLHGARVIGLTRSPEKADIVSNAGADHVVLLDHDWVSEVLSLTEGRGVDAAFDSVGSTLTQSLAATRDKGHLITYGTAGGYPSDFDIKDLMTRGIRLGVGELWNHLNSRDERLSRARELFSRLERGQIKARPPTRFKLSEGRAAHHHLEQGKSTGKVLLIPNARF